MTAIPPNTPPPRSLGSSEPPRASSEIHSDGSCSRMHGDSETIGSESLPAVGASVQRMMDWIAQSLTRGLEPKTPEELHDEAIAAARRFVREATDAGLIVPREYLDSEFRVADDAVTVEVELAQPRYHFLVVVDPDTNDVTVTRL